MAEVAGIILAGGRSSRMGGGDKCLRLLGQKTLLDHAIGRIRPQVATLALNANGEASRFREFGLPVVADPFGEYAGPLAGVLAGMDWAAAQGLKEIVTVAADTPFFPHDLVEKLRIARDEKPLAMAITDEPDRGLSRHPTFGLWPVNLRADLRTALQDGVRKVVQWTSQHGCAEVLFANEPVDPFFNVNHPKDLVEAERIWQRLCP